MFLLKGPHKDLLADGHTCPELQHRDGSSKGTRDIWRGTEFSGIRARAGGAAFFRTEVLVKTIVPLLSLPTTSMHT